jgi:hypothetical protein
MPGFYFWSAQRSTSRDHGSSTQSPRRSSNTVARKKMSRPPTTIAAIKDMRANRAARAARSHAHEPPRRKLAQRFRQKWLHSTPLRRDDHDRGASGVPGVVPDPGGLTASCGVQQWSIFSPVTCSLGISRENDPRWKKGIGLPMFIVILTTNVLVNMLICFVEGALLRL